MITFSLVSGGTSVAALFMAGYLPGILWGLTCMIVIYFFAKKHGYRSKTSFTFKEAIHTILQAIPALLLIIIVIGGIIGGVFTATEGSVVAVVYSLLLSLFGYKSIKLKEIPKILRESAEMTGIITPPVGTTLFVGVKVGGVKIETVFKQLIAYFAAIFAVLMLVTYVPQISLALPSLMGYVK